MIEENERLVYTVEEAGKLLGLSRPSVYKLATTGQIPTLRLGHRLVVPKRALEEFLANVKPAGESQK